MNTKHADVSLAQSLLPLFLIPITLGFSCWTLMPIYLADQLLPTLLETTVMYLT